LPIHVTAAGRALLSQYTPAERAAVLRRIQFQAYQRDDFMTPESVEDNIAASAVKGWYMNPAIYAPGVAGIAVPFPFRGQRYAIALGGPLSRIEAKLDELGNMLHAEEVSPSAAKIVLQHKSTARLNWAHDFL
jgi:IclR family acetate operon transcriptional repressor